jgi:hypothetical protein
MVFATVLETIIIVDPDSGIKRMLRFLKFTDYEIDRYFHIRNRNLADYGNFYSDRVIMFPTGLARFKLIFDVVEMILTPTTYDPLEN